MRGTLCCALLGMGLGAFDGALARTDSDVGEASARACPPGEASRIQVVTPPGSGPVIISGRMLGTDSLVSARGRLFFGTNFLDGTSVLWSTDGTPQGTSEVKKFSPAPIGPPRMGGLVAAGSRVFFEFQDPATGNELWVSNGTEAGTRLVKDLSPGPESTWFHHITALDGLLVFVRTVSGSAPHFPLYEVWRSDGTSSGTFRVAVLPSGFQVRYVSLTVDHALHLFLSSGSQGTELWRTDGTSSGTFAVKKLDAANTSVNDVSHAGDLGLFVLDDSPNAEVWKTDGTRDGTLRLESFGSPTRLLGTLGSQVYLATASSDSRFLHINRVSLSGGGKTRITTLPNPFADKPEATPYIQRTTRSGGKLYFSMAISDTGPAPRDVSLWVTDGTADGTKRLHHPLSLGDEYFSPLFAATNGTVFFTASTDGLYPEPWFTRGTLSTTGQLADISPGTFGSAPDGFAQRGDHVFFFAHDDTGETQLWGAPIQLTCPPGPAESEE
ncbi:putative lipoprotein [Myxococcus stipitatus DSM 14675]|uniref:Putative lipoprotein n=2 Tax=Myxococcus stipitatus TaxID=83455 RepID=L7U4P5_MYXSD|nr:putative lipoprotein [Myxococcus stipitatus DSM 14675]